MKNVRMMIIGTVALTGFALGVVAALPLFHRDFITVTINGTHLVVEVAADAAGRARGLSGRESMAPNQAMLFLFPQSDRYAFWMKDMRFPLDIFWIRDGVVVDMEENVPAPVVGLPEASLPVYRPDAPADAVLETVAGFARIHNVRIGDSAIIAGTEGVALAGVMGLGDGWRVAGNTARPGEEYTIEYLHAHPPAGSDFTIGKIMSRTDAYNKFAITYRTDGMALTGVMNVPSGPVPAGGFPVLILNHGLIYPDIYFSGRGSKREQDFFARHGYVTIHPDYRGYSSITPVAADVSPDMAPQTAVIAWPFYGKHPAFSAHHDFYEGYTADVLALIDALKKQKPAIMDISRIGMWGHSMGGGIAERLMVRTHDVRAYVLFAAISADAEDNFYELTPAETAWLHATYGAEGAAIYRDISPVSYAANVSAPVQIHHGLADADVPSSFSRTIFDALTRENKKTELFTYPGEQHEFIAAWPLAAGRALQFFDRYVKNAK